MNIYTNTIIAACGACKVRVVKKGETNKRDLMRYALIRAVAANYNNCLAAGFSERAAYDHAIKFATTLSDPDVAEILQTAALAIWIGITKNVSEDDIMKRAYSAINSYLNSLHEERRYICTEEDLFKLFAANIRKLKRAAGTNIELKNFFDGLNLSEKELQICELLARGYSKRAAANELGVQHNTVNYWVSKIQKKIISEPPIQKYLID